MSLAAVARPFVSDIAYVIRIETLRSTPLIVDASASANAARDRLRSNTETDVTHHEEVELRPKPTLRGER